MKRALSSSGVHPDSERRQAAFTDFWFVVTRFQLLRGCSDYDLAKELLIDPKTVTNWRKSIGTPGVLQDLVDLFDELQREQPGICDQVRQRTRDALSERLTVLQEPSGQKLGTRSTGLPAPQAFGTAVEYARLKIFDSYFMDMEDNTTEWTITGKGVPDKSVKKIESLSEHLKNDLIKLYKTACGQVLTGERDEVEGSIKNVASVASRLALQGEVDLMSGFPTDTSKLAVELADEVEKAKRNARAFARKIYEQMRNDDSFSERAAFRGRLALGEGLFQAGSTLAPDDPLHPYRLAQAERALKIRLESLIDEIASIRVRKG